jgi:hypothetical protein
MSRESVLSFLNTIPQTLYFNLSVLFNESSDVNGPVIGTTSLQNTDSTPSASLSLNKRVSHVEYIRFDCQPVNWISSRISALLCGKYWALSVLI